MSHCCSERIDLTEVKEVGKEVVRVVRHDELCPVELCTLKCAILGCELVIPKRRVQLQRQVELVGEG